MGKYTHGSESFYIEGEGLVMTQVGGHTGDDPDPVNESETPRAKAPTALAADEAPPFRFSRVGPKGTPVGAAVIKRLAKAMIDEGGGDGDVPAGYTYLGQFIDHDLTMDRTKVMLGKDIRPIDMLQGRSPRLDLDSLYGHGPGDAGSAKFYKADGLHLKTGDTIAVPPDKAKVGHDLPRVGKGPTKKAKRTALIPDPRNDENLIVAQTHLAMIHFHNRVLDSLPASVPDTQKFVQAREQVTLHYQWMIRHDFLPRICVERVLDNVFEGGRKLVEPGAPPHSIPTMPVEFSVAAFRLGHSMVRQAYNWNRRFAGNNGSLGYMFDFSGLGGDLGGNLKLASNWIADFRRMYDFDQGGHPRLKPASKVNHARRIDTLLTIPLSFLPPSVFGGSASIPFEDPRVNLAFRNLTRGAMVKLASGQQMVAKLKSVGVNIEPLTRAEILNGKGGAELDKLTAAEKDAVANRTPLWFYVLREAELHGGRLHGVGARIVAETFHRAIEGSRFSIIRNPAFRPTLGRKKKFEMTDLIFFAYAGKRSEINPLGGS
jgi:Animal haem peroxidase